MSEDEIREFLAEAISITGDQVSVVERIAARWLKDREEYADDAREDIYMEGRDSWESE